jgi:hypothetical protein
MQIHKISYKFIQIQKYFSASLSHDYFLQIAFRYYGDNMFNELFSASNSFKIAPEMYAIYLSYAPRFLD